MKKIAPYNYRKCTLCGVRKTPYSKIILTRFPLDPDRCRIWVKATGDEDLVHLPIEKLHSLKYLCDSHFTRECFNKKGNRLLSTAVPTEKLIRPFLSDECLKEFPLHLKSFYHKEINKPGQPIQSNTQRHTPPATSIAAPDQPIESATERHTSPTTSVAAPEINEDPNSNGATESSTIREEQEVAEESIVPVAKTYTWQKQSEAVCITADEVADTTDDVADMTEDLTMYCDDEEPLGVIEKTDKTLHEGYQCDVCKGEIRGFRYTCVQCSDLDLCSACELDRAHHHHYVLRVPEPRPYAEVQSVLARIRNYLMQELDPITQLDQDNDDAVSVKSENKSESEDDKENDDTCSLDSSHSTVASTTQEKIDQDNEEQVIDNIDSDDHIDRTDPLDSTECNDSVDISSDEDTQSSAQVKEYDILSMEADSPSGPAQQQPTSKHKATVLPSIVRKKIISNIKDFIRMRETPLSGKKIRVMPLLKKSDVSTRKESTQKFGFKPQKKVMVVKLPPGPVLNDGLRVLVQRLPLSEETRHNADIDNR